MVIVAVLCHCVAEVASEKTGTDGLWTVPEYMSTFFYVDDIFVSSLRAERLKRELNVSTDIFYWVLT